MGDYFLIYYLLFWLSWAFTAAPRLSSCSKQGLLFAVASHVGSFSVFLVVEHKLCLEPGLSSCGTRTQLLHSVCSLHRPVSPTLVGGF